MHVAFLSCIVLTTANGLDISKGQALAVRLMLTDSYSLQRRGFLVPFSSGLSQLSELDTIR